LGIIPKDWKFTTIGDCLKDGTIIDVQDGNHGELHPKAEDFVAEGVPFLMANDLVEGEIDFENCHKITDEQYYSLRIGFAKSGDVLLSHKGTIGQTAIIPSGTQNVMLTPQVTYYRVSENGNLLAEFLLWFFRSSYFQHRLQVLSAQSTRAYIGITLQKTLAILIPPRNEQKHIVKIFSNYEERIKVRKAYLEKLKLLKKGLMSDLLTGRVRVKI
jgi:type I restriction enzyme S subunit